jgi:4-amino-4-deoxy-L-arabinose transferase-like glycosyltransferase
MLRKFSAECALAVLLFAFFSATTLLWISLDRLPPNWDDAWYLTKSLTAYDALTAHGLAAYLSSLNSAFGFKAPLIAALPTPFYLLFGRRWHAAYLVNIASMFVLFAALYRIASRRWTPRAAVIAIAVAGTMPLLYGLARWYLVEYALTAFVAVAIALLMETDSLDRPALTLLFGALCGFGLLLKAAFPIFLLPSFLLALVQARRRVRSVILAALPCLAIALPWYAAHWHPVLANGLDAGFGTPAAVQGLGPIFALSTILAYLELTTRAAVSVYYVVLTLALGFIAFASSRRKSLNLRFLFLWMLPFAVFLFGGNKDVRYIAPILPALALLLAALLDSALPRNRMGAALAILLLAFPVLSMLAVSFGVPWRAPEVVYARRYAPQRWPHDEMLRLIAAGISREPGHRPLLLVASDRGACNANNLELTAVAMRLPLSVETTAHEPDRAVLFDRMDQADFFLYEEGGEAEYAVFNPYFAALVQRAKTGGAFNEIPYGKRLPDGGIARIFRRSLRSAVSEPPPAREFDIPVGALSLTSVAVETASGAVTVRYAWTRLQQSADEYWSFTHLVDAAGKIVAQSDRPLPLVEPGRAVPQLVRVNLPAGVPVSALRLRFGLYVPASGLRPRIGPLPPAAARRFQLADNDTALIAPVE